MTLFLCLEEKWFTSIALTVLMLISLLVLLVGLWFSFSSFINSLVSSVFVCLSSSILLYLLLCHINTQHTDRIRTTINIWFSSFGLFLSKRVITYCPFFSISLPGCSGSNLPLYGEAASDHGADGVLSGGHQGEWPQWFPSGKVHYQPTVCHLLKK